MLQMFVPLFDCVQNNKDSSKIDSNRLTSNLGLEGMHFMKCISHTENNLGEHYGSPYKLARDKARKNDILSTIEDSITIGDWNLG